MTTNNPPLTAEQTALHWCMANGYGDKKMADILTGKIKDYAAQQTQALQQRVDELEAKLKDSHLEAQTTARIFDALQAKLDDAQAQVAMLVEKLAILIDEITDNGSYPYDTPKEITVHNSMGAVLNTQNAAEQWKADLLKPYQEAVKVLREALQRIAHEQTDSEYDPSCDEPHSSLLAFKALKDTEGLV